MTPKAQEVSVEKGDNSQAANTNRNKGNRTPSVQANTATGYAQVFGVVKIQVLIVISV